MSEAALRVERRKLLRLQVEIDIRLAAVEAALRIHRPMRGRPRKPYTMTADEAREAHQAYNNGDRTPGVLLGNAEYQRRWRRGQRASA